MPQLFDYIEELHLVDWSTIVIYTCSNKNCLPDFSKGNYLEEYTFVQFSEDFSNVKYGDEDQMNV
jgi:hypothetical protein